MIYIRNFLYKPAASFLRIQSVVLPEERASFECESQEKKSVIIERRLSTNKDRTLTRILLPVDAYITEYMATVQLSTRKQELYCLTSRDGSR